MTLRNIGFSDASELFVFLAGYSAALAYSKRFVQSGYFVTALHILRRSWILYIAHVFLLAQLMALIFIINDYVETRDLVEEMGLTYFIGNPVQTLVDGLLLRFKPGLLDPLPLYIILLITLAAILPLLLRHTVATLSLSVLVYIIAVQEEWNLHSQTYGAWFFNPLAWQLLFFLGAATGIHRDALAELGQKIGPRWLHRLLMASLIFLGLSALIVLSWNWPQVHDRWMPQFLAQLLYPIDKTNLALVRLLHFLVLMFCVAVLLPQGRWLSTPLAHAIRLMGRHSLVVFCLGVLLAPLADSIDTLAGDTLLIQWSTALAGCIVMWLLALLPEWFQLQLRQSASSSRLTTTPDHLSNVA